ncbi:MAG: bifunctional phosphoribosylaminoimidazolecarboxamide formyltransferase/IMP cyclohydrolase, partial [Ktedonobacteraceae bacterium]|nr:bifunctional phosphoribosylaminoimidazolecarboxamide formyltransferase/IMP cyclohydrolase [Ktedonobacteraceae bacterium]
MRAIISVAEREGLVDLAHELQSHDVTIYATSTTRKALKTRHIDAHPLDELSGFPAILDGSVAALHPLIMGGVMAQRDQAHHTTEMRSHHITPIDLVVVNFFPFGREAAFDEALEQIDVGGAALIRAAAKNFRTVIVLVRPQDYASVMQEWREQGEVSLETRRRLAVTA